MNYRIERDPAAENMPYDDGDQTAQVKGARNPFRRQPLVRLADDLGVTEVRNTASHHQFQNVGETVTHSITVNEADVDPEEVAEDLRHRLGTQVDVNGAELTIYLLTEKIARNLQLVLKDLLGNDDMANDNVYKDAA